MLALCTVLLNATPLLGNFQMSNNDNIHDEWWSCMMPGKKKAGFQQLTHSGAEAAFVKLGWQDALAVLCDV